MMVKDKRDMEKCKDFSRLKWSTKLPSKNMNEERKNLREF